MAELPQLPESDDLIVLIEGLQYGLQARSTGGDYANEDYQKIRRLLLAHPTLSARVPGYVKSCRDTDQFWQFIKTKFSTYAERRVFIQESLAPLLNDLEYAETDAVAGYERVDDKPLGEGGYGVVYKYKHRLLDLHFAVKVFAPRFAEGGEDYIERFFREARILFALHHTHIVRIYDVGLLRRRPFIRMEFVDGDPLSVVLDKNHVIRADRALWLVRRIAEALQHAHDRGIVHRDLKPSNLMVGPQKDGQEREVRVIDFGIGVFVEQDLTDRLTRTGQQVAGGLYTAPELLENPKLKNPLTDIYSLGAIWYHMLVGRAPAGTGIVASLEQTSTPKEHVDLVTRCLAGINDRPSAAELLDETRSEVLARRDLTNRSQEPPNVVTGARERDLTTLSHLVRALPTVILDEYLEYADSFIVIDEIFHFWTAFDAQVNAGYFQIFDGDLLERVLGLHKAWGRSLGFGEHAEALPGQPLRHKIDPHPRGGPTPESSRIAEDYLGAVTDTKTNYRRVLEWIKQNYPEIDLRETTREAMREYHEYISTSGDE
jgi:serine/threonine-protein kinase